MKLSSIRQNKRTSLYKQITKNQDQSKTVTNMPRREAIETISNVQKRSHNRMLDSLIRKTKGTTYETTYDNTDDTSCSRETVQMVIHETY